MVVNTARSSRDEKRSERYHLSPAALAEHYAELEAIGRRCDGNNRRCTTPAVAEYRCEPEHGEECIKRACSRHRASITRNPAIGAHEERSLTRKHAKWGPITDPARQAAPEPVVAPEPQPVRTPFRPGDRPHFSEGA